MVDLHRHDSFSRFDGFGGAAELAALAKSYGYTALSTSNHGNTNGLVQTWAESIRVGIKPILGVEGYFLPKYQEKQRGYHLCLFAKGLEGYKNLNTLQYYGDLQKYYNPIWDFNLLQKYSNGLICTTACIASYSSQAILNGKIQLARRYLQKLKEIFGGDLYIEIQPYSVSDAGAQERVNIAMLQLGKELKIPLILTSDSHRGAKEDFPTYLKMHEINGHDLTWVEGTYKERYMPKLGEMEQRFIAMHGGELGARPAKVIADSMVENLEELESKVDKNILGKLELKLPKIGDEEESWKEINRQCREGLKKRGQFTPEYISRCKEELNVIRANGFIDYFLIVSDYVNWAKSQGIVVGPGRGSACNSLASYALGITDVDSIRFNLDFRRFMRYDKKAIPDIDMDFEMGRRAEVISYLLTKYPGKCAQVSSYGQYKTDNCINDLAKVCGLPTDKTVDADTARGNKEVISEIKSVVSGYQTEDGYLDIDGLLNGPNAKDVRRYNKRYDDIITHFTKLYGKVRFIGTHAAGLIITSGDLLEYSALRTDAQGSIFCAYNLEDLNSINLIKFDLLGLKTMQSIGECRRLAGVSSFDIKQCDNPELLTMFRNGETCGIFQFEKKTAKKILNEIHCDSFNDVIAVNAMNRPGPLSLGMPETYAEQKLNSDSIDETNPVYKITGETFGSVVYQEQLLLICTQIGGLEWNEADVVQKANKHGHPEIAVRKLNEYRDKTGVDLKKKFLSNAVKRGMSSKEAVEVWDSMMTYSFNKGHACGYSIISMEEMYYKKYYPTFFWYAKIKYARDDKERDEFCIQAVAAGSVIFLPHVNYSGVKTTLRKVDGEYCLQQGLADIKGIGEKAADSIVQERKKNGIFTSWDNFYDRCHNSVVNKKVVEILQELGVTDFNKKRYIKAVKAYNTALYGRAERR